MKNLSNLKGAKALNKIEQKSILGGWHWYSPPTLQCANDCGPNPAPGNNGFCTQGAGGQCISCGSNGWKCVYR